MNNKGFAVSGIFYTALIIFLLIISIALFDIQSKKTVLDKLKTETVNAVGCEISYNYLLDLINKLNQRVETNEKNYDAKFVKMQKQIDDLIAAHNNSDILKAYPVGSIYISTKNTNPDTLFGGTWVAFGSGRTLLSSTGTSELTGGSNNVTLSSSNLPSHTHSFSGNTSTTGSHTHTITGSVSSTFTGRSGTTSSNGSHKHSTNGSYAKNVANNYIFDTTHGTGDRAVSKWASISLDSAGEHTHTFTPSGTVSSTFTNGSATSSGSHSHSFSGTTGSTGSGSSFSVQNPYITVYMWKRTA